MINLKCVFSLMGNKQTYTIGNREGGGTDTVYMCMVRS